MMAPPAKVLTVVPVQARQHWPQPSGLETFAQAKQPTKSQATEAQSCQQRLAWDFMRAMS